MATKYKTVWSVHHFDGTGDKVEDRRFDDFDEAMKALALFPGKWSANWTVQSVRKGNHFLGPELEELKCESQPSEPSKQQKPGSQPAG